MPYAAQPSVRFLLPGLFRSGSRAFTLLYDLKETFLRRNIFGHWILHVDRLHIVTYQVFDDFFIDHLSLVHYEILQRVVAEHRYPARIP